MVGEHLRNGLPACLCLAAAALTSFLGGCETPTYSIVESLPDPPAELAPPLQMPLTPEPIVAVERRLAPPAGGDVPPEWTPATRDVAWRFVVIHHSATEHGNASLFDSAHRGKGWDELGYHFVITNGNGGADGVVEIGPRWQRQKWGAHCKSPDNMYNRFGVGICLVGDFGNHLPSARQLASLDRLTRFLCSRYGIVPENVIGHRDAPQAATECPGDALERYLKQELRPSLRGVTTAGPPRIREGL